MYESVGKIGFPGIVEAFNLVPLDGSILVGIAGRIIQIQNAENSLSIRGRDLLEASFGVILVLQVSSELSGEGGIRKGSNSTQPMDKILGYSLVLIALATWALTSGENSCSLHLADARPTRARSRTTNAVLFIS